MARGWREHHANTKKVDATRPINAFPVKRTDYDHQWKVTYLISTSLILSAVAGRDVAWV